jgi:hypothetical protein
MESLAVRSCRLRCSALTRCRSTLSSRAPRRFAAPEFSVAFSLGMGQVQARRQMLARAADDCCRQAKSEEAMELYTCAGEFARALEMVNAQLGNNLGAPGARAPAATTRVAELTRQVSCAESTRVAVGLHRASLSARIAHSPPGTPK